MEVSSMENKGWIFGTRFGLPHLDGKAGGCLGTAIVFVVVLLAIFV